MPTLRAPAGDPTRTTTQQFVELLCADEDLLRAEFDAIIAAEWPSPPPSEPDHGAAADRRPRRTPPRAEASAAEPPGNPRHAGSGESRQRSPPPSTAIIENRKGR